MSYARPLETGSYIWSDGEYMTFNFVKVPEEDINIFLAKLFDSRNKEFYERVEKGRQLIEQNKIDLGDDI